MIQKNDATKTLNASVVSFLWRMKITSVYLVNWSAISAAYMRTPFSAVGPIGPIKSVKNNFQALVVSCCA